MPNNIVRWGIAGLGNIAHRFVSDLTQHVENVELRAVAARDEKRAKDFADTYGCPSSYGSYRQLAEDANVDVVYISTIHPYHKNLVELCLLNGKHVLVEKPAFTNERDWLEMSALAKKNGLILLEAMKSVAFPAYQALTEFILNNEVVIDFVEAAFGNWHKFDPTENIFNPNLSGGATLDVGVYPLWLYVDLCRLTKTPIVTPSIKYAQDNPGSGVDENVEFLFDGKIKGKISASITRDLKREAIITGPDLKITIAEKWWNPTHIHILYKDKVHEISIPPVGGGFEYEIEHVSNLIRDNQQKSHILHSQSSQRVAAIMESALTSNGYNHLVKL
ncbi:Gfo/Idh/MocA family oxidoreductase [Vibrio sp. S4M6]|uniref:Gfo/Idh/MocA family protein n=1 Tax=Vibrio sinus TaxID=2946865 RepID=UPI002029F059|nr:Gfo/Idh/MocA family oxidoreductase [Vibrio sinus]MCL9781778.1 Gfo/Idh/MocA family oxidoreductase [Vibrio sinus]